VAVAFALASALGAWGALGTFTMATAEPGSARVGLLPSWATLALVLALTGALMAAALRRRMGPWSFSAPALALLPWVPVPMPAAFLAWAGPWTAVLWVVCLASLLGGTARESARVGAPSGWLDGRRGMALAGLTAFVFYTVASARVAPVLPGGDEPHYLIITQSLLLDGDLRIEDNHRRGDYRAYASGVLRPDFLRRGTDREIYSIHLPGASVLVLPAFAAGGYPLVKLWLALLAAVGTAVAWRVARRVGGSVGAAWVAWAATALTAPFLFLAFTVYPDGPGALAVVVGFAALVRLGGDAARSPVWWTLASLAPALLPWLHPRFAVVAGCFGLVCGARAWQAPRRVTALLAFAVVPALSAIGWFGYYYTIYGSANPSAAYGHYTQMAVSNAWRGLIGLAFDQQFGLAGTAPVYLLVVVGLWRLWQQHRRLAIEWLVIVCPYVFVSAMYHMWWGGHSSPARFLGCVMLVCAVPVAAAWQAAERASTRTLQLSLLGASLLLAGTMVWVDGGRLVFNTRDGIALWAAWASRAVDIARALPSVFSTTPGTALAVAAAWIGCAAVAWAVVASVEARWRLARPVAAAATGAGLVLACAAAMTAGWRTAGVPPLAPAGGQITFLRGLADNGAAARLRVEPLAVETGDTVGVSSVRIDGARVPGRPAWALLWVPLLPAGTYRVTFEIGRTGSNADVDVLIGRGDAPVETWALRDLPRGPVHRDITIRWPVRSLTLRAAEPGRGVFARVFLEAVSIRDRPGAADEVVTMARRYGRVVVSIVGQAAYLEAPGLWTAGGREARLLVESPAAATAQDVIVRGGAVPTRVDVSLGDWRTVLTLAAGETRPLSIPLAASGAARVLAVTATPGFRPSEADPASTDSRLLGAWLEFR